jgi:hypothetical protein
VIALVWIIGIYAMIFGVALMVLGFRARGRYHPRAHKVRLRQPETRDGRELSMRQSGRG